MAIYVDLIRTHPLRFALVAISLPLAAALAVAWTFPDHQVTAILAVTAPGGQQAQAALTPAQTAAIQFNLMVSTLSFQNQVDRELAVAIPNAGQRSQAMSQTVLQALPSDPYTTNTIRLSGRCPDQATCGAVATSTAYVFSGAADQARATNAAEPSASATPSADASPAAQVTHGSQGAATSSQAELNPSTLAGLSVWLAGGPTIEPGGGLLGTRLSAQSGVGGAALGLIPALLYLLVAAILDQRTVGASSLERRLGVRVVSTIPAQLGGKHR